MKKGFGKRMRKEIRQLDTILEIVLNLKISRFIGVSLAGKILEITNSELSRDYSAKEVEQTLKQMNPTKAPGSDGMVAFFFYQKDCLWWTNQ